METPDKSHIESRNEKISAIETEKHPTYKKRPRIRVQKIELSDYQAPQKPRFHQRQEERKRIVGKLIWMDANKDYGYILTNKKDVRCNRRNKNVEIYFSNEEKRFNKTDVWVTCEVTTNLKTINVREMTRTQRDLSLVLEYREDFAYIEGYDRNKTKYYLENIISNVYNEYWKDNSKEFLICVIRFLEPLSDSSRSKVIKELIHNCEARRILETNAIKNHSSIKSNDTFFELVEELLSAAVRQLETTNSKQKNDSSVHDFQFEGWDRIRKYRDLSYLYPNLWFRALKALVNEPYEEGSQAEEFLKRQSVENIKKIFKNSKEELPEKFLRMVRKHFKASFKDILSSKTTLSDKEKIFLLAEGVNPSQSDSINWSKVMTWFEELPEKELEQIIEAIAKNVDGNDILEQFNESVLCRYLKNQSEAKIKDFLASLSSKKRISLASNFKANEGLYNQIIKEEWERVKSELNHVTYDLTLKDNKIIRCGYATTRVHRRIDNPFQLRILEREIRASDLLVSYQTHDRNYIGRVLESPTEKLFIWDVMEMEILISPYRTSYIPKKGNDILEDTMLIDKIFWSQICRLSFNQDLCNTLTQFLPEGFSKMIQPLQETCFIPFLEKYIQEDYFQTVPSLDKSQIEKLKAIKKKTLIVAPRHYWKEIARHIEVDFVDRENCYDYRRVSRKILERNIVERNSLEIINRTIPNDINPILGNIPHCIRNRYIPENIVKDCLTAKDTGICCCDYEYLLEGTFDEKKFDAVVFVEREQQERILSRIVRKDIKTEDLADFASNVAIRMSSCGVMNLSPADLDRMNLTAIPDYIRNIWLERNYPETYKICENFNFEGLLKNIKYSEISLNLEESEIVQQDISVARLDDNEKKYKRIPRVYPESQYRSLYWAYQLRMLKSIEEHENGIPIIYVLENKSEIDNVERLARENHFNIPEEGSLKNRLDMCSSLRRGLIIITQNEINGVWTDEIHNRCIFVWDNLAFQKEHIIWKGINPVENIGNTQPSFLKEDSCVKSFEESLIESWDTMKYVWSMIRIHIPNSKLYVIDPYLDDYNNIMAIKSPDIFYAELWETEEEYKDSLLQAEECHEWGILHKQSNTDTVIAGIKEIFIGKNKNWHKYQKEVLTAMLQEKEDILVSIPTGGGKSVLFQGPALYQASVKSKLSIVISPLKTLMEDQVLGLNRKLLGLYTNIDYLDSDRSQSEIDQIYHKIQSGSLALLYITPERFRSKRFQNALKKRISLDNGLEYVIFDEAHCISQWGKDFRPDYLNAALWCKKLKTQYPQTRIALFSATITKQMEIELNSLFYEDKDGTTFRRYGQDLSEYNPIGDHTSLEIMNVHNDIACRIDTICEYIKEQDVDAQKSRILIFCRTRSQCETCSRVLKERLPELCISGYSDENPVIAYFHAGMDITEREKVFLQYKEGKITILCATKAFGMGMDIPNIHYLIHFNPPFIIEDFLQEIGRVGRNKESYELAGFESKPVTAVCLVSDEDFRNGKELLIRGISRADIESVRKSIVSYIDPIRDNDNDANSEAYIPFNLWRKDSSDHSYANLRLCLYWLEKLGRISTGSSGLYIRLSIKKIDSVERKHNYDPLYDNALQIYEKLTCIQSEKNRNIIQVSVADLGYNYKEVLDGLIECITQGWISIEDDMPCDINPVRKDEIHHILTDEEFEGTIEIMFRAAEILLSLDGLEEKHINDMDLLEILNRAIDEWRHGEENENLIFMPWYTELAGKNKTGEIFSAETYLDDLRNRRMKYVIGIIDCIPGIEIIHDSRSDEEVRIKCNNNEWRKELDALRYDCYQFIFFLGSGKKGFSLTDNSINLSSFLNQNKMNRRGYEYLHNVLFVLKGLGFINSEDIFTSGIKISFSNSIDNEIRSENAKSPSDVEILDEFERQNWRKKLQLAAMRTFIEKAQDNKPEFIHRYFSCKDFKEVERLIYDYYSEETPADKVFLDSLREVAIEEEEKKLGEEQKAIYYAPLDSDINVLAGPGSGKTHVLTLRCARLIYREHVKPSQIIVLAYNRAIVLELRRRLKNLLYNLGLSNSYSSIHIHTFAAMVKIFCPEKIKNIKTEKWEEVFLKDLEENPGKMKFLFPDIRFIMIDEFQDINQIRLDSILRMRQLFVGSRFFIIGDKNQSIYGFDKRTYDAKAKISAEEYYKKLKEHGELFLEEFTMRMNYRSYQGILDAAKNFLENKKDAPVAVKKTKKQPGEYVHIIKTSDEKKWIDNVIHLMERAATTLDTNDSEQIIEQIGIFFRTNNEVHKGFRLVAKELKEMLDNKVIDKQIINRLNLRIQGTSESKLSQTREIFEVLLYLNHRGEEKVEYNGEKTQHECKEFIKELMKKEKWDKFYLDLAYTLILEFLNLNSTNTGFYTFSRLADDINSVLERNCSQVYNIYERYKAERINQDKVNIIFTTMHKVKGLEFDAVVITPSYSALPFHKTQNANLKQDADVIEELKEERRLYYVAYTRAKKELWAYKSEREEALEKMEEYEGNTFLGMSDKPEIDKLFLNFTALERNSEVNDYIREHVQKNDPLTINLFSYEIDGKMKANGNVVHDKTVIGRLSSKSDILKKAQDYLNKFHKLPEITQSELLVSEVSVWLFKDTEASDENNGTSYSTDWSEIRKSLGYTYLIDFNGYIKFN